MNAFYYKKCVENPEQLLQQLPDLLNRQQQVNQTGQLVAKFVIIQHPGVRNQNFTEMQLRSLN
ncbi:MULTISPECIES: hypothetical protein [unclassified Nostoc]|uniref:hypothetical protein n=1 Tax=unclassified Nostoc TaxID=2593658 RepID=UPI002AD4C4FE|nr:MULTISPECIES: hypothetical protein [unclassified Nostoc]MDZ8033054.1 hypothetical protein [Nostoc sp. DedSLP04]MDZ8139654.1 hypothetical protein [Nostoc sp. DedQUE04]